MKIFNNNDVSEMVNILKNDGILCVPTDTVYGLCVRINSEEAFNKLVSFKNRPANKSFPVMCSDIEQIKKVAVVDEVGEKLINSFMPGPITIVLKKRDDYSVNNRGTMDIRDVGIRMATSPVLKKVIDELGMPIFMTSANLSGEPVCTSMEEIKEVFPNLDGILEGRVSYGLSSTIVSLVDDVRIIREGPISSDEIMRVVNDEKM